MVNRILNQVKVDEEKLDFEDITKGLIKKFEKVNQQWKLNKEIVLKARSER